MTNWNQKLQYVDYSLYLVFDLASRFLYYICLVNGLSSVMYSFPFYFYHVFFLFSKCRKKKSVNYRNFYILFENLLILLLCGVMQLLFTNMLTILLYAVDIVLVPQKLNLLLYRILSVQKLLLSVWNMRYVMYNLGNGDGNKT